MSTRGSDLVASVATATLTLCLGAADGRRALEALQTAPAAFFGAAAPAFFGKDDNGHVLVRLSPAPRQPAAARRAAVMAAARAVRDRLKADGINLRVVE